MTNVTEVVLFYSKFSKECGGCIEFIMRNKLPVTLIPLDTKESREHALNGSLIQIRSVPSMVVSYANSDVQLYVGSQKIIAWFTVMSQPRNNNSSHRHDTQHNTQHDYNTNLPQPDGKIKGKKSKKKKSKSTRTVKPQSDPSQHTELIFDDGDDQHYPSIVETYSDTQRNVSSKLSTSQPKPSPNASIMAMAAQMGAERDRQINYDRKKDSG
jgi:hypothetical protein